MRQTGNGKAKGERDVHHCGWIVDGPRDAGGAADQHQKKRSQGLAEHHHQKVNLRHLLHADEIFRA